MYLAGNRKETKAGLLSPFPDLSPLMRDSKLALRIWLPEKPLCNSWTETNKNNYRAVCGNVKCSPNTLTPINLTMNLGVGVGVGPACL